MEITPLVIYLISLADRVNNLLLAIIVISTLCAPFGLIASCELCYSEDLRLKWIKRLLVAYIACIAFFVIIPSSKTLIAMYVIPPIATSEVVNEIPDVLMDFVKSYVGDLKKDGDV